VQYPQADAATGPRRPGRPADSHPPAAPGRARDPWLRIVPDAALVPPLPGQPGHGQTALLRRQPARIVDGRAEGGYTSLFELICPSCGDHPYLDYSEIPARLQQIRGPYPIYAGLAAYEKHLEPPPQNGVDRQPGCGLRQTTADQVLGPRCPGPLNHARVW
jgi:hypothetical protein